MCIITVSPLFSQILPPPEPTGWADMNHPDLKVRGALGFEDICYLQFNVVPFKDHEFSGKTSTLTGSHQLL